MVNKNITPFNKVEGLDLVMSPPYVMSQWKHCLWNRLSLKNALHVVIIFPESSGEAIWMAWCLRPSITWPLAKYLFRMWTIVWAVIKTYVSVKTLVQHIVMYYVLCTRYYVLYTIYSVLSMPYYVLCRRHIRRDM